MSSENTLMVVAIIVVIVSATAALLTYTSVFAFERILLGPADDQGTAQIQVLENARIDFTFDTIDFGSGKILPSAGQVVLDTSTGNDDANWVDVGDVVIDVPNDGLIVENIGNVNLDFDVYLDTAIDTWLVPGPSTTSAQLDYMVQNCVDTTCNMIGATDDDTAAACMAWNAGFTDGAFTPIGETIVGVQDVCDLYLAGDDDEMRIDLRLTLPEDIQDTGGAAVTNDIIVDIDSI